MDQRRPSASSCSAEPFRAGLVNKVGADQCNLRREVDVGDKRGLVSWLQEGLLMFLKMGRQHRLQEGAS